MNYNWSWEVLLQPVATGEPSTYLGWITNGFVTTFALTVCAWVLALAVGTFFGILRTLPSTAARAIGTTYVSIFRNIRSEEHTSELQSLMRISYAVFCLKKKKK